MTGWNLLIRDVEVEGKPHRDVRVRDGSIVEIGVALRGRAAVLEGEGGALIPGLIDHHIHLMASAAAAASIDVGPHAARTATAFARVLRAAASSQPNRTWLRAVGYHEAVAGPITRDVLDAIVPERPLRVQHASGSLWTLNSAALRLVIGNEPPPACVEHDTAGRPTGRIWRGDAWLRPRVGAQIPDLGALSARMARAGVTGVCDASATTDAESARLLADAV